MRGAVSDGRPYRDTNMLVMLLCRDATYVTSAILPILNVKLTSLPIAHIVLILKASCFLRTTPLCRLSTLTTTIWRGHQGVTRPETSTGRTRWNQSSSMEWRNLLELIVSSRSAYQRR